MLGSWVDMGADALISSGRAERSAGDELKAEARRIAKGRVLRTHRVSESDRAVLAMKAHPGPRLALVALLLACASRSEGPSPPPPPFVGRFSAVSESEWTLDLTLYPDGSAVIERSGWDDWSESDETEREAIPAHWSLGPEGDLLLSYRGTTDVLRYFPDLSRTELGETGSAPGLRAFSPGAESVIGSHSLWRSDGPD